MRTNQPWDKVKLLIDRLFRVSEPVKVTFKERDGLLIAEIEFLTPDKVKKEYLPEAP